MKRLVYSALLVSLCLIPGFAAAENPPDAGVAPAVRAEAVTYVVLMSDDVFLLEPDTNCDPHMLIPVTSYNDPGFLFGVPTISLSGEQYG